MSVSTLYRSSNHPGGDVFLIPAVELIGDGPGKQTRGEQRIHILSDGLLATVAEHLPDLTDALRLILAEGQYPLLCQPLPVTDVIWWNNWWISVIMTPGILCAQVRPAAEQQGYVAAFSIRLCLMEIAHTDMEL